MHVRSKGAKRFDDGDHKLSTSVVLSNFASFMRGNFKGISYRYIVQHSMSPDQHIAAWPCKLIMIAIDSNTDLNLSNAFGFMSRPALCGPFLLAFSDYSQLKRERRLWWPAFGDTALADVNTDKLVRVWYTCNREPVGFYESFTM